MKFFNNCVTFLIVLLLLSTSANAQRMQNGNFKQPGAAIGKLSGVLIDARTLQPVEYGSVVLHRMKDSSMVNGAISDEKGRFIIDKIPYGKYFIKISFVGYTNKRVGEILINPQKENVELGTINLNPSSVSTQEVVITSEKDMIVNNLDKKVINVDKNVASAGGSAIDVMQSIPSVSVDASGSVSMRGNSNVTVLIDGKPSGLMGLSSSDVLSQIPASSIESIEVVTNPSARYDPEGTSGIINIVLKKKANQGVNGIATLNAGNNNRYNLSLNINYKKEKFNLFGSYDNRLGHFIGNTLTDRTTSLNDVTTYLNQDVHNNGKMSSHNFNFGADYFLNDKNTLTLTLQHRIMGMDLNGTQGYSSLDMNRSLLSYFERRNEAGRNIKSFEYSLNYKGTSSLKGEELTADATYSANTMNRNEDVSQRHFGQNEIMREFSPIQRTESGNKVGMLLVEVNYARPLRESSRIEAGFKSTIRNLSMSYDAYGFASPEGVWINNPLLRNHFDYQEQIHAVYAMFSGSLDALKYQAGLRAEQVLTDSKLELSAESFKNNYFSLYPTAHLSVEFDGNQEALLSYSRRVDRPNYRQLNPYVDYSDSLNIVSGNPRLMPQYINSYELGYSKSWEKSSFTSTVFYRQTSGIITSYSKLLDNGVTNTSFMNLNTGTSYGAELIANKPLLEWWKINVNFSYFRTIINGNAAGNSVSTDNYSWTGKLNSNMTLWENINLMIMANYKAPQITAQGRSKELYSADAAVRRDFLDGKLSVTLRISDIFNTMKYNSETYGPGFYINSRSSMDSRAVFLGLTYKINNYNKPKEKEKNGNDTDADSF
ncbi:MAG: TonB-dependent receptor domain-containing protein [Ignavibacteriales bacterium]